MSNTGTKDYNYILNMLDSIRKIQQYTAAFSNPDEFNEDSKSFDATLMNFIAIGEMVDKLSDELKDSTQNELNWPNIKGFRNILAHNYFGVDAEEVWQIIQNHLPGLYQSLQKLIEK